MVNLDINMPVSKNTHLLSRSSSKGFTLIELLIVTVILGILAAIGLRSFQSTQMKSRDARRKEDLAAISQALEAYYNDKGGYPLSNNGQIVGCDTAEPIACTWGQPFQDDRGTFYMTQLPEDPRSFNYYYVSSDGSDYQLYARFENDQDQSIARTDSDQPTGYTGTVCAVEVLCNYGIASSNSQLADIVELAE